MLVEEMWSIFNAKYMLLVNKYITTQSDSRTAPKLMNKSVLCTVKKKRKAWLEDKLLTPN